MRGESLDPLPPLGYSPYFSAKNRGRVGCAWLLVGGVAPPLFCGMKWDKKRGGGT